MYIISMAALFNLRRTRPHAERSYKAPFSLIFRPLRLLPVVCMGSMLYNNVPVALVFCDFVGRGVRILSPHSQPTRDVCRECFAPSQCGNQRRDGITGNKTCLTKTN
jgi:hypothetical protein